MARFKREPGEQVLMKGAVSWIQGEIGFVNVLRGRCKITSGVGVLTSKRLVARKAIVEFPWGPLFWLIRWILGPTILFSIPRTSLASVRAETRTIIVRTIEGQEYRMMSDSLFDKTDEWVRAIREAIGIPAASSPAAS